jgi:hypothetical protein
MESPVVMPKQLTGIAGFLVTVCAWAISTAALAEVKLTLDGVYGDEAGCKLKKTHTADTETAVYFSSEGYGGVGWYCKFVWAHEEASENIGYSHWVIITLCHLEGQAYSELLAVEQHRDTISVAVGPDHERKVLYRCE